MPEKLPTNDATLRPPSARKIVAAAAAGGRNEDSSNETLDAYQRAARASLPRRPPQQTSAFARGAQALVMVRT